MNTLAQQPTNTAIVSAPYEEETITLLDQHAPGGITTFDPNAGMRMWAATISAGYKDGDTPRVVRDGKIRLHEDMGEAPGIKAALAKTDYKSLTIMMLSDSINDCLKQLFCAYGKTKIFGDSNALTVIKFEGTSQERMVVTKDNPKFPELLKLCKPSIFVPFALAEWDENDRPRIGFTDGYMPYRLRFGSKNSARGFCESLLAIKRLTGGKLVGVPLELRIVYKSVMTPDGKRANVPVWLAVLKHPKGITLGADAIRGILESGIKDASQLALPAPIQMDDERVLSALAESDADAVDEETGEVLEGATLSAEDIRTVTTGEVPKQRMDDYFRAVQNTPYARDEARPRLIQRMADAAAVHIDEPSLRELAEVATAEEWLICTEVMCKAAAAYLGTEEAPVAKATVEADPLAGVFPETNVTVAEPIPAKEEPVKESEIVLPEVKSYLTIDRTATQDEQTVAKAYVKSLGFTGVQKSAMTVLAGGISIYHVYLEAKKRRLSSFESMAEMLNATAEEVQKAIDDATAKANAKTGAQGALI